MGQPRRNEKRCYRYPLHRVVAVIHEAPSLGFALADPGQGRDGRVQGQRAERAAGARLLDLTGVRHGLREQFLRWRQQYGYETDALQVHSNALETGRHVIYVPVNSDQERQRVIEVLRARGGHHLLHLPQVDD
jgi:hypothetical protein